MSIQRVVRRIRLSIATPVLAAPLALLCSTSTLACGGGDSAAADTTPGATNSYLHSLPAWPTEKSGSNHATGSTKSSSVKGSDRKSYACKSTPYSMTSTPQDIVTFNPNADVLWPGALLQGKALQAGAFAGLPITQRAPLKVSIPTLLAGKNTITVENPDVANVEQAIGQLIGTAVADKVEAGSSISYQSTEAYSLTQAALSLGLSAEYLGSSVNSSFSYSSDASLHTIVGYFVQNMFTAVVPEPEQPEDMFSSAFTPDVLKQQVAEGNIGPDNLPVYVASVTYGRILMFSITSTESASDIQAALNAQFKDVVASGSVSASYSTLMKNSSTSVQVVALGGDAKNAEAMIQSGDPKQFFTSNPALTAGVPISYTLRNLGNNSIAAVSESTSYSVQQCTESSRSQGPNFYVLMENGSVATFDSHGTPMPLANPIQASGAMGGIAYDFADDFMLLSSGTSFSSTVGVFNADGSRPSGSTGWLVQEADFNPADFQPAPPPGAISYDPRDGRVYVVVPALGIDAYTPAGLLQQSYAIRGAQSVAFDSAAQQLFAGLASRPSIERLDLNGSIVTGKPDAFAGLVQPVLAYDAHHDLIDVADASGKLCTFETDGTKVASVTLQDPASAVVYDDDDDRVFVTDKTTGLVSAFTYDLKPVSLEDSAFAGLAQPVGIAYRP